MTKAKLFLMIYWMLGAVTVFAVSIWAARRASAGISDCIDATCRITTADGSRGTGCVFEITAGRVFVLTAAHVTGANSTVQCEFWRHGHRSKPLAGSVIARAEKHDCDAAIVALSESQFGGMLPTVVPIAPRETVLAPGQTVTSVGCAKGAWSTGWKGHLLDCRDGELRFRPTPANGRSGSAIFDARGTMIVGLLRARTVDTSEGIGTSLESLYAHLSSPTAYGPRRNTQYGSGGCPGGVCPTPSAPQPYLLPYRRHQEQRRQNPVWPTMPDNKPPTPSVSIDLDATNDKLDGLTGKVDDLILEIRTDRESQSTPGTPETAEDAAARQVAEEAKAEAHAAREELDTARAEQGKLRRAVDVLVGDRETLKQRFDARIAKVKEELGEDAGRRDVARAYVKDLAAEKLSGTAGWTLGKVLALSLGLGGPLALAIAAAGFFVSRRIGARIESGEPLLVQRVFDRLGDKIDDLKDRLHDDKPAAATSRRKARS